MNSSMELCEKHGELVSRAVPAEEYCIGPSLTPCFVCREEAKRWFVNRDAILRQLILRLEKAGE